MTISIIIFFRVPGFKVHRKAWASMLRNVVILPLLLFTSATSYAGTVKGQLDLASLSAPKIQQTGDSHFWHLPRASRTTPSVAAAVVLENDSVKNLDTQAPPARLTIKGYGVLPSVVTVRLGDELEIDNLDQHPYSCTLEGGPSSIDLEGLGPEAHKKIKMMAAGVLNFKCKKFPFMNSIVVVSESPLSAVADYSGQFQMPNVPPGQYVAKVYASGKLRWKKSVVISSLAITKLSLGPTGKSIQVKAAESHKALEPSTNSENKPGTKQNTLSNNVKPKDTKDKKPTVRRAGEQKQPDSKESTKPKTLKTPLVKNKVKKSDTPLKVGPVPAKNKHPKSAKPPAPSVKKKPKPTAKPPRKKKSDEGFKNVEPEIEIEVE